jgi:hypothetical protein
LAGDLRRPAAAAAESLCVRHHLTLRAADQWAARVLAQGAVQAADMLIAELAEAFDRSAEARLTRASAPGSTAWRRAAAYLDGAVFGGCPPR